MNKLQIWIFCGRAVVIFSFLMALLFWIWLLVYGSWLEAICFIVLFLIAIFLYLIS